MVNSELTFISLPAKLIHKELSDADFKTELHITGRKYFGQ